MALGLPQIMVEFKSKAASVINRGSRGVVALVLKDELAAKGVIVFEVSDITEVPQTISKANQDYIEKSLIGGVKPPRKVIVLVIPSASANYIDALNKLETMKFDYLAIPGIASADTQSVALWVKAMRENKDVKIKVVLPDTAGDNEGIINFTTTDIDVNGKIYTSSEYTARIAGLLAGTPLNISATYYPLPEIVNIPMLTKEEYDEAIKNGKFVLYHDGEKVKVARAVNSLVTTTVDKGEDFKKIKIVDIMDLRHDDIKKTVEDCYIGKYPNSYDNKLLIISAIKSYDKGLEQDGLLDPSFNNDTGIDLVTQKNYLNGLGIVTSAMNEQQIKEANTQDKVFLLSNIKILDAIEDFKLTTII